MARLEGKCAVITGATSGLGEACAIMFAKEGAQIVATGRKQEKGDALVARIAEAGGTAYFIAGDMRKKEDVQALHDFALDKMGKVDVLVNSAGVLVHKPFLEQNDEDFNLVMETNLRAYIWTMQSFIPDMEAIGGGSIINIASISAFWPELYSYFYGCTKASVANLSMNVACEFAKKGIRINTIEPGPVLTAMTPAEVAAHPEDFAAGICPLGRIGVPDDIAYAATYLASDESSWVTAAELVIDGGVHISNVALDA